MSILKNISLILILAVMMTACGSDDEAPLPIPQPTPQPPISSTPTPTPTPPVNPPVDPSAPGNYQGVEVPVGYTTIMSTNEYVGGSNNYQFPEMNYTKYKVRPGYWIRMEGTLQTGAVFYPSYNSGKCSIRSNAILPIFINGNLETNLISMNTHEIKREGVLEFAPPMTSSNYFYSSACSYYKNFKIYIYRRN